MSMPIGLWIPHSSLLCPGNFFTPTTVTRMSYIITQNVTNQFYIPTGCDSRFAAGNTALSMYQNAYITTSFTILAGRALDLNLFVGGTFSFMPTVQVDGTTYLTTTGGIRLYPSAGDHTLTFSINPVGPGTLSDGAIHISAGMV